MITRHFSFGTTVAAQLFLGVGSVLEGSPSQPHKELRHCESSLLRLLDGFGKRNDVNDAAQTTLAHGTECDGALIHWSWQNSSHVSCVSRQCLGADIEDTLGHGGHFAREHSSNVVRANVKGASTASLLDVQVGACIEGVARRISLLRLSRLSRAMEGMSVSYHVVGAISADSQKACARAERSYRHAFSDALVQFHCSATTMEQVREEFFAYIESHWGESNASWWRTVETAQFVDWSAPQYNFTNLLLNFEMKSICLRCLESAEAIRGSRYDWVIYLRNDYDFFAPHPPLHLMKQLGGIWIPDGEDWGGINDRWAVMERKHARAYFNRTESFRDLRAQSYLRLVWPIYSSTTFVFRTWTTELVLLLHLWHNHIWPSKVHRFLPVAAVSCLEHAGCYKLSDLPRRVGWRGPVWWDARSVALRLQQDGWAWKLTHQRKLSPECPSKSRCCGLRPLGGDPDCFAAIDVHSYQRCCSEAMLGIQPPVNDQSRANCWDLTTESQYQFSPVAFACVT